MKTYKAKFVLEYDIQAENIDDAREQSFENFQRDASTGEICPTELKEVLE